ncbi:MAG: Trk system potassium transporter TrkA [Actinobacteria bacterium]|nr:Trk system potassium transporter TrkA [Actinomycetota bacterium]
MRIIVVGAGHVGMTIVEALHEEHELIVVDLDAERLRDLSYAYDVRTVTGNGANRLTLEEAGIERAELLLASTARAEANLVAAMLARRLSAAKTIVRTTDVDYLESWREGYLDVDYMVSAEIETAREIAGMIAVPGARATEQFADGQVLIAEFDVPRDTSCPLVGGRLGQADLPPDSTVSCIVRDDAVVPARAQQQVLAGDRLIVIGSPSAAREWSQRLAPTERPIDNVVIFGAGHIGGAVARELLDRGFTVRIVEPDAERAQQMASEQPRASVFHATGLDRAFLRRERIGGAGAVVTATGDDAKNLYLAILARSIGVPFTLGVVDDPISVAVFEQGGVDVAVNPRLETAEQMIRFAHDPRTRQLAMLDDDRFEVLDIVVRPDSELAGVRFRDLPQTGSVIGALVRDGTAVFPRGDEVLRPGDRAIVLTEAERSAVVERAL